MSLEKRSILPVSLLLENRRVLLVGGGRVAARKLASLVQVEAMVTVVARSIKKAIRDIAEQARGVTLAERSFQMADLDGADVVFCATDDRALNARILAQARQRRILASAADSNWPTGDFIMPATVFAHDFTVSVSTAGRACRQARQLKDNLGRHLQLLHALEPFVYGVDHLCASFSQLETALVAADGVSHLLATLLGVHEFFVLQTCNRFEVHGLISADPETETVVRSILNLPETAYFKRGAAAEEHVALVAAGVRSQAPGEKHIVAQLKKSVADAIERGYAGSDSQRLLDQALESSKFIRRGMSITGPSREVEDLALAWIHGQDVCFAHPLIIGRGMLGQSLKQALPGAVMVSGRDREACRRYLRQSDLVIVATDAPTPVLAADDARHLRPDALLVDLSMPAGIDPAIGEVVNLNELRRLFPVDDREDLLAAGRRLFADWRQKRGMNCDL